MNKTRVLETKGKPPKIKADILPSENNINPGQARKCPRYVAKAITPYDEETGEGEQGPFYRYFNAPSLEQAAEYAFRNRHALFTGGAGAGSLFGSIIAYLGLESVMALAVKQVGDPIWHLLLDQKKDFQYKKNHCKYELESVRKEFGDNAFKDTGSA
jgi:hypothetical protein